MNTKEERLEFAKLLAAEIQRSTQATVDESRKPWWITYGIPGLVVTVILGILVGLTVEIYRNLQEDQRETAAALKESQAEATKALESWQDKSTKINDAQTASLAKQNEAQVVVLQALKTFQSDLERNRTESTLTTSRIEVELANVRKDPWTGSNAENSRSEIMTQVNLNRANIDLLEKDVVNLRIDSEKLKSRLEALPQ